MAFTPPAVPQDQPDGAREYFRAMRMPGKLPVTPDRYDTARRRVATMRHYSIAAGRFVEGTGGLKTDSLSPDIVPAAALGGWQNIGPGNIGGRTRSLVIHPTQPNIMYAGAVDGGVWKTADSGTTWTPLTDLSPNIAITTLVMDPQNPNIIYAGTGEGFNNIDAVRGAGILKTTDGGTTWTQLPSTTAAPFSYVFKLLFGGAHNLYAATWTGVYRSSDGGTTWTRSLVQGQCQEMAGRTNTTTDTLFASCVIDPTGNIPQVGIFRNTDAGGTGTWTQVFTAPNMARTSLAIAPSQQTTIYAMAWSTNPQPTNTTGLIGVFQSLSSGDANTWTTQTSNASTTRLNTSLLSNTRSVFADTCFGGTGDPTVGQGWYGNALAVDPVNPNVIWAASIDTFRSDDGGRNWGLASYWSHQGAPEFAHADHHGFIFPPAYNGTTNQSMYVVNDGGIFRTDNSRAATQTGDRAECPATAPLITWTSLNNGYTVTQFYHGLPYPAGASYIGGAQDNGTNRGTSFLGPNLWRSVSGGDGGWVAIDPVDPNGLIFEYVHGVTYRSDDGGLTQHQINNGITEPDGNFEFIKQIAMDPNNPMRLYVGGFTLWRTEDQGDNWVANSKPITTGGITAIAIAPSNSNTVYFGDNSGNVYRNTAALNGSATVNWNFSTPRTDAAISSLAVHPTNPLIVYAVYSTFIQGVSGDFHIYKSTDGGVTWAGIDGTGTTGIPDVPVNAIVIDPLNAGSIYVGTDLGVYVSLDSGASWSRDSNPFANAGIGSLAIDRGSGVTNLYAFTHGRSAWRTTLPGSGTACTYALDKTLLTFPAGGGALPVTVTTGANCYYSAQPTLGIAQVQSPAAKKGTGQLFINVPALNPGATDLLDGILIQGQLVGVTQKAATHSNATSSHNDEAVNAAVTAPLAFGVVIDPTYTSAATDPVHSCTQSADKGSSWWQVVAPGTGQIELEQQNGAVLSAYTVTATKGPGTELACVDGTTFSRSVMQFNVTRGVTYLVEVSTRSVTTMALGLAIRYIPNTYITVTTPQSTLTLGQIVQANAAVVGPDNLAVRWSISPEIGSISPDGVYTAPASLYGSATIMIKASSFLDSSDFGTTLVYLSGTQVPGITVTAAGVANAATFHSGSVAPGEIVTVFGSGFGPAQLTTLALGADGEVVNTLADTQVLFDGVPAPMIYAVTGQVSAVVPFGVAGKSSTVLQVKTAFTTSAPATLPVTPAAPGLFTLNASGSGEVAILNQDGSLNSAQNPAPKGSVVVFYATGGGTMKPAQTDGQVTVTLSQTALPGTVTIGGADSAVAYLGAAPGFVAGVLQANVTVPVGAPSGSVPVVLTIRDVSSVNTATMFVK